MIEQHHEGDDQHDRGDHRRACTIELFELDDDEHRGDFRNVRQVPGDENDRSVLADGTCEGERKAGENGRRPGAAG